MVRWRMLRGLESVCRQRRNGKKRRVVIWRVSTYPWGNTIDSSKANYNRHIGDTTAVGEYTANGYGLYDMAGNVWEWCLDEYNGGFYAVSPSQNPLSGAGKTTVG